MNRTKYTRRTARLALALALCILLNLLIHLLPERVKSIDLSGKDTFRISGTTTDFLTSLDEDITLTLLCKGGRAKADSELYAFLSRYADASRHITLRVADPERETALIASLGNDISEDMSIAVESRRRTKLVKNTDLYYYSLYDSTTGQTMTFSPAEYTSMLAYYAQQEDGETQIAQLTASITAQFDGESRITNAIGYVTEERTAEIYELNALGTTPLESSFIMPLEKGGFDLHTAAGATALPDNCDILIINTPTKDLSDRELTALADYLSSGGKLLLTTAAGSTAERFPNLTALLAAYGLGMPREATMLCEGAPSYLIDPAAPYLFYTHINSRHPATADFDGQLAMLAPHAITLTEAEDAVTHAKWLYTSKNGYLLDGNNEKRGEAADYTCGAIAEKGNSAILWLSSAYALTSTANSYSQGDNYTLLHSALSHLSGISCTTVPLAPRAVDTATLSLSEGAFVLSSVILILLIPATTAAIGAAAWYVRKKK